MSDILLDVKDLVIHYETDDGLVQALNGVSLQIHTGKTLGLVGETGAGKTTLAKGIMQLVPNPPGKIKGGEVFYDGEDLLKKSVQEMREVRGKQISMIFQDPMTSLNPTMKIGDQIAESILIHRQISKEEAYKEALEMLQLVKIPNAEKRMKQYPFEFSGGMRQRAMIAIALACKPEILIADEPTTALDVTIQAQILDLMNQLKKETGTSILFITHDLGVVAEVCDDVAVMYCGRVVERGDVKTIFANPSHPYTKGLLGSIPRLGDAGKELKSIPGNVPNPKYMPKGCKFEPRCPYASEKCREEEPGFFQIEEGHISRCWLCESGQLKTDHVEKAGD